MSTDDPISQARATGLPRDDGRRWQLLDPATAVRAPGAPEPRATVYERSTVLVGGLPGGRASARLSQITEVAEQMGWSATVLEDERALAGRVAEATAQGELRELAEDTWVTRVQLAPAGRAPQAPPDAWHLLQQLLARDAKASADVGLDHLVRACEIGGVPFWVGHPVWVGHPFWGGHPFWLGHGGGSPVTTYAQPGMGGRSPVAVVAGDPSRHAPRPDRPPVVAGPDPGLGAHPGYDGHPGVIRGVTYAGLPIGGDEADQGDGAVEGLDGTLAPLAGHGTFIAGLLRQGAPAASILPLGVMDAGGSVSESDLLRALALLLLRHVDGQRGGRPDEVIDVLSLSLGYYHETPQDAITTSFLRVLLDRYGAHGVVVVAAAGNDATTEPLLPAGFAADRDAPDHVGHRVPLVSVGALNPPGDTAAFFSNDGSRVSCWRPGAALVSTLPTSFEGAGQEGAETVPTGFHPRGTIDLDDFTSGFGIWSGTSFAAPVLAAEVLAHLTGAGDLADTDPDAMVARGWDAVRAVVRWERP